MWHLCALKSVTLKSHSYSCRLPAHLYRCIDRPEVDKEHGSDLTMSPKSQRLIRRNHKDKFSLKLGRLPERMSRPGTFVNTYKLLEERFYEPGSRTDEFVYGLREKKISGLERFYVGSSKSFARAHNHKSSKSKACSASQLDRIFDYIPLELGLRGEQKKKAENYWYHHYKDRIVNIYVPNRSREERYARKMLCLSCRLELTFGARINHFRRCELTLARFGSYHKSKLAEAFKKK